MQFPQKAARGRRRPRRMASILSLFVVLLALDAGALAAQPVPDAPPGYLRIIRPPGPAFLILNGDFENAAPIGEGATLALAPGLHSVTIATDQVSDIVFGVRITSGQTVEQRLVYRKGSRQVTVGRAR